MNTTKVFLITLFLALTSYAGPGSEDVTPMVQEEFKRAQADINTEWKRIAGRLGDLQRAHTKAVEDSKKKAETQNKQVELMKKYGILLGTRYRNDKGEYDRGMELSLKDGENLNKMFRSFLAWTPIQGRMSVGEARRIIDWGVTRLGDSAKANAEPTDQNNSDLELITHQMRDLEGARLKVETMAKSMDVQLEGTKSKKPTSTSDDDGEKKSEDKND